MRAPGTPRVKRAAVLLAALFFLATNVRPGDLPVQSGASSAALTILPVALDPDDPRRRRVGALDFLGGWTLASDDRRFGGISAMHVADGQVTAISDAGILLRFAIPGAGARARVRLDPLPDGPGPATRKSNRDTEAMLVRGNAIWAAFEKHNMVWRYDRRSLRAAAAAQPPVLRRWHSNAGAEAMVRLGDGRFLMFAEGRNDGPDQSDAALFEGDPAIPGTRARALRYRRPAGFRVTDAALLPDGRLLVLHRRFAWFAGLSAVLAIVEPGDLANRVVAGRDIAALRSPLTIDNMEALSVTVEDGRTIIWIASDDNFNPLQRTLLLKFALRE